MEQIYKTNEIDIRDVIRSFIIENYLFGVVSEEFSDDDSLLEKEILNSTGVLELIAFLEESYEIQLEDEEILPENLDSVNNICGFIERKTSTV